MLENATAQELVSELQRRAVGNAEVADAPLSEESLQLMTGYALAIAPGPQRSAILRLVQEVRRLRLAAAGVS